ncbi:aspartate carbamoyltransferase catalytic subunit [Sphingomicrobium clamense]|uniref:Aspartate carbamoyltransferase n=1 Tax=Sphingomicrobium clamense TaxID=2851013 RepID=A0ABS6V6Q4_9SPHN|nr:aspartate carbamoyltransferase catalytic subunit [Sphingomicrobium sp. B8]MBW0145262.1 aspartate carbamoyltransferase catalytic subunit [Sphingomicrobium sp. B8]
MDLITIDDLKDEQLDWLMDAGLAYFERNRAGAEVAPKLAGKSVITAFFEASTRTLMSFEVAARRLGAEVTRLPVERSSVLKGESLKDTVWTLQAMSPAIFVIRHGEQGAVADVARWMSTPVLNAGDGAGHHPTQGLLDVATIKHKLGRIEGLKVAICGDIRHSRVANSTAALLERMGAEVRLAGPAALMPEGHDGPDGIDEAIAGADVVMILRVQRERLEAELGDGPGEYLSRYGLTEERVKLAAPQVVVMHPGPMNRGVEIADSVADGPRSVIRTQVEMGVAMRMAVLQMVAGA